MRRRFYKASLTIREISQKQAAAKTIVTRQSPLRKALADYFSKHGATLLKPKAQSQTQES